MSERNEADALFATKRKKQQEEQAEQERREELSRKKAEMEAEIQRLEEEVKRQKEQAEQERREELSRKKAEMKAEIRSPEEEAKRQKEQPEKRKEKKGPLRYLAIVGLVLVAVWVVVQLVDIIWFVCSLGKGDVTPDDSVLTGEEVFGIHFDRTASAKVFDYNIYYPDSFEEIVSEDGALFTYGSAEDGDFSYVLISGIDMDSMEELTGSTDPAEYVRLFGEFFFDTASEKVYETTSKSNRTAYHSGFHLLDLSQELSDMPEGVCVQSSVMVLVTVEGEGYLTALYGTMSDDYMSALDETVVRFLDHTS
ncbi:MAG: hypothetical protein ACI4SD_02970 [Suilimivivens sp.]